MWQFLMAHSAVLDENRGSHAQNASSTGNDGPTAPFVGTGEMSNDVLVENALSWLLD
jgi:hypothetical protein